MVSTVVMMNEKGESLGFGFVCFRDPDHALNALKELNGKDGLFVCRALKRSEREAEVKRATERYKKLMLKYNLYIKNFPSDSTEEELNEFFSKFGEVKSVKIVRQAIASGIPMEDESEKERVFGFVSFTTIESARTAKNEAKKTKFKGKEIFVSQFESKAVRAAHVQE